MTKYSPAIFEQFITLIGDAKLQSAVREALDNTPPEFWVHPASKTGKYHPHQSLGEGGLIRHTMRAVTFFIRIRPKDPQGTFSLTEEEYWCGIAALILHDCQKHTYKMHCSNAAHFAKSYLEKWEVDRRLLVKVVLAINKHQGPWSDGMKGEFTSNKYSNLEWAVYMADLYSAQRWLQDAEVL